MYRKDRLQAAIGQIDEILKAKDELPPVVVGQLHKIRKILRWHYKNSTRRNKRNGAP